MELMSSTSEENCELWNGSDVVRCQGLAPVTEFICLVPNEVGEDITKIRRVTDLSLDPESVGIWNRTDWKGKTKQHDVVQNPQDSGSRPGSQTRSRMGSVRSRHPPADEESLSSIPLGNIVSEHPVQPAPVQSPTHAPGLVILRNTSTKAPNITLNRYLKATQCQLLAVACFGVILQFGVLLYFAFITYHPSLKFKKDDKDIAGYAFPLASGGTGILVLGMLLCAHVVDHSTEEERYEPSDSRKMRMVWLQQKQTISDQVFHSFVLFPRRFPQVITTSQRRKQAKGLSKVEEESSVSSAIEARFRNTSSLLRRRTQPSTEPNTEMTSRSTDETRTSINLCVIVTLVCLSGFLIQFIGLRGIDWSASVGQLIAVMIMTILRAYVRRGFTAPINSQGLRNGFELEGLALASGSPDSNSGPGSMSEEREVGFRLSKSRNWMVMKNDDGCLIDNESHISESTGSETRKGLIMTRGNNQTQETLEIRRHLAHLAGWQGPESREARCLAKAMEVTLDMLCPKLKETGAIQDSGPMDLNQGYLTHIPPLHGEARLGELDCVIEATFARAKQQQKHMGWSAARKSYKSLLLLAEQFHPDTYTFARVVALVDDYIRSINSLPLDPRSTGEDPFPEATRAKKTLVYELNINPFKNIRDRLEMLHECQQCSESPPNVDAFEIQNSNFTKLHSHATRLDIQALVKREIQSNPYHRPVRGYVEYRSHFHRALGGLGRDSNAQDILGCTPLHYVAARQDEEVKIWVDYLFGKGADVNAADIRGRTPLHHAIMSWNTSAFRILLEAHTNTEAVGVEGMTPLHYAAMANSDFMVKTLLSHPRQAADQFARDIYGRASIHVAAANGSHNLIKYFRGSIESKDTKGRAALHLAACGNHSKTITELARYEANLDIIGGPDSATPLHFAFFTHSTEAVQTLLTLGADVNSRSGYGWTPLREASCAGHVDIVSLLINKNVDINSKEQFVQTLLFLAAGYGQLEVVQRLLHVNNIDVNIKDDNGERAEQAAYNYGRDEIFQLLQDHSAMTNVKVQKFGDDSGRIESEEQEG
ncbi:unnamed protein product [Fusarium equiseti]|uniref:Ankyrin repeat protein n=1 Tax=Fusarium equiseti TaxID=61235 RepID=A0A8J2NHR6_FUSEQ|nr:unnamed protein product [Fusarium equiseti]